MKKAILLIIAVIALDQWSKIYIKTNFMLGEEVYVFDWFRIHFIENNGAAWGAQIGGKAGKLFLTVFRLFAIVGIGYWLRSAWQKNGSPLLLASIALIFAGALGNIIDSVFYGVIFDHSNYQVATLFAAKPYGELLHGKVVDMLYFPIWQGTLPSWLPLKGGESFTFFNAIFNIADSAITIGVMIMIFFGNKLFPKN